jgi:hypothetical protein
LRSFLRLATSLRNRVAVGILWYAWTQGSLAIARQPWAIERNPFRIDDEQRFIPCGDRERAGRKLQKANCVITF